MVTFIPGFNYCRILSSFIEARRCELKPRPKRAEAEAKREMVADAEVETSSRASVGGGERRGGRERDAEREVQERRGERGREKRGKLAERSREPAEKESCAHTSNESQMLELVLRAL